MQSKIHKLFEMKFLKVKGFRFWLHTLLDVTIALSAFIAAWYWFKSSIVETPLLLNNWDQEKSYEGFNFALKQSSALNKTAASWSGLSATLMGIKLVSELFKKS